MTNELLERTLKDIFTADIYAELQDAIAGFQYVAFHDYSKIVFREYYDIGVLDDVVGFTAVATFIDLDGAYDFKRIENVMCDGYIYDGEINLRRIVCNGKTYTFCRLADYSKEENKINICECEK